MPQHFDVTDYGADPDVPGIHRGRPDNDVPILAAIDAAQEAGGGVVVLPVGIYRIAKEIDLAGRSFLEIVGAAPRASVLVADTALRSLVSLIGARHITLRDLELESSNPDAPVEVCLALGSAAGESAGHHDLVKLVAGGYASKAIIYSVASEVNSFIDVHAYLDGGGAKYVFYTSERDGLKLGGRAPTSGSNLVGWIQRCTFRSLASGDDSAVVFIDARASTGSWVVRDTMIVTGAGSVVRLASDGARGPFVFDGIYAQSTGPHGFYLENAGAAAQGVSITNCFFTQSKSTHFLYAEDGFDLSNSTFENNASFGVASLYSGWGLRVNEPVVAYTIRDALHGSAILAAGREEPVRSFWKAAG